MVLYLFRSSSLRKSLSFLPGHEQSSPKHQAQISSSSPVLLANIKAESESVVAWFRRNLEDPPNLQESVEGAKSSLNMEKFLGELLSLKLSYSDAMQDQTTQEPIHSVYGVILILFLNIKHPLTCDCFSKMSFYLPASAKHHTT